MSSRRLAKMMWLLWLSILLSSCKVDHSISTTEVTVTEIQIEELELPSIPKFNTHIGDTIPGTILTWTRKDAEEVMYRVKNIYFRGWRRLSVSHCSSYKNGECFERRLKALSEEKDRYIRELQILGAR